MKTSFHIWILFGSVSMVTAVIPSDDFLFGTDGKTMVWFQNGTEQWLENGITPSTSGINFSHNFLGIYGASFFHQRNFLVFSDTGGKSIFLTDATTRASTFAFIGTSAKVRHLAIDWLSGNLYWCDEIFNWIGMIPLPPSVIQAGNSWDFKVVVDQFLHSPSGITVLPDKQYIFWTDTGKQPKIERASLDGSSRKVILVKGVIRPIALTRDPGQAHIYWTDSERMTVESCDVHGNNRRIVRSFTDSSPFGIEFYQNHVLVSSQPTNDILTYSIEDGRYTSYRPGNLNVVSIGVFTGDNQIITNDACSTAGCEQICFVKDRGTAKCNCLDGYQLAGDDKACQAETKVLVRSIAYVNNNQICTLPITFINIYERISIQPDCTVGGIATGAITHLAINVKDDELYLTSGSTIYHQKLYQEAQVFHNGNNDITGLCYDWINGKVYWTEGGAILNKRIDQLVTSVSTLQTTALGPTFIAINPLESVVFVVTGKDVKQIEAIFLANGTSIVLESLRVADPKWIIFDYTNNRLYWTDGSKLGSMTPTGRDLTIRDDSTQTSAVLHGIVTYKKYILWLETTATGTFLFADSENSVETKFGFAIQGLTNPTTLLVYDKHIQPQNNVPCIKDNGGCQHLCVVDGLASRCECYFGYKLQADNKSCETETFSGTYFLTIDSLRNRMFMVNSSSKVTAVNTGDISPEAVCVDYRDGSILWVDGGKSIKILENGEKTLTSEPTELISSIDVDSSTGNIYYTTNSTITVYSRTHSIKRQILTSLKTPTNLVLFPSEGKMFWSENEPLLQGAKIRQAFMDGSNIVDVRSSTSSVILPRAITIDSFARRLIWSHSYVSTSSASGDLIESISLDNFNDRRVLMEGAGEFPIAFDVDDKYLYYISRNHIREVRRVNKDGTGASRFFYNILFEKLSTLKLVSPQKISTHSICEMNNGFCSKLCLPKGPNQRTCQCRMGVGISEDGKRCQGDVQCQNEFGNVILDDGCTRYSDSLCKFTCKPEYRKISASEITCLAHGNWNFQSDQLCSAKEESETSPLSSSAIIGISVGAVVLIVLIVPCIVCLQLRRVRKKRQRSSQDVRVVYDHQHGNLRDLTGNGNIHSTEDFNEVYDQIQEDKMIQDKIDVAKSLGESGSSHRYSHWPREREDPPPDYLEACAQANGNSPYLTPKNMHQLTGETPDGAKYSPYLTPVSRSNVAFGTMESTNNPRLNGGIENQSFRTDTDDSGYFMPQ